jgi:glycosyltransferase involved in cell wall biosynthesis
LAVVWAQYGPYHFARAATLARFAAPSVVHAIEVAGRTDEYEWARGTNGLNLITLCPGEVTEQVAFSAVFLRARRQLASLKVGSCFLPSYAPRQSLAVLLAAKSLGLRTVMMNETHAGTARATGLAAWVKRRLIGLFDAALVGGLPQKRYFASMGLAEDKIFTGYDAVDNDYFFRRAEEVRSSAMEVRTAYSLPDHYFLSLGRFVAKKNLETLIRAYRLYLNTSLRKETHLVMVGSGAEEPKLQALCRELNLPIYDHSALCTLHSKLCTPAVHFYGFRQIDENPAFYALADAFILPSQWEEWGLVVNEAMACGSPVAVSETAGCAEDLLEAGCPAGAGAARKELERFGLSARLRRNGFVFNPGSSEELSRVLLAFEGSTSLRASMAVESRRIVERFSCEKFAQNALRAAEAALS